MRYPEAAVINGPRTALREPLNPLIPKERSDEESAFAV
jgi:hypothetical protein